MYHIIEPLAGNVIGVEAESPAEMEQIINTYTLPARWTVIPRGAQLIIVGDDGGSLFTPEYQAILNYATTQGYTLPSATNQNAQNTLVANLKDAGIWTELDVFYNFLTDGDHNFAKINWKNPGTFQAVGTGHEPVYTSLKGFTFNGTTQYLSTGFLSGPKGSQDNISLFSDAFDFGSDTAVIGGGFDSVSGWITQLIRNLGSASYSVNMFGSFTRVTSVPYSSGLFHAQRIDGDDLKAFVNGSQIDAGLRVSASPTLYPFFIGARNGSTILYGNSSIRMFGVGSALIGKESALYNAWKTYANPIRAAVAYQAIIDRANALAYGLPSANCQTKGRQYILDLMNAGIWDALDVLYPFATDGSKEFATLNWKNPLVSQAVAIGVPVFTTKDGYTFDGSTSKLNTTVVPMVGTANLKQNDACIFEDVVCNSILDNLLFGINDSGFLIQLASDVSTGVIIYALNMAGSAVAPGGNNLTNGFYSLKRTASNALAIFRNGVQVATASTASVNYAGAFTMHIGGRNGSTSIFKQSKARVWGMGASLNGKEAANYNAWTAYFNGIQ